MGKFLSRKDPGSIDRKAPVNRIAKIPVSSGVLPQLMKGMITVAIKREILPADLMTDSPVTAPSS